MPGGIKISKPERLPKEHISEADLYAWWNELMNYLNQHDSFKHFKSKGFYSTWDPAEISEDRIDALDVKDTNGNLDERQRDLNNIITIIAGCCARDHYMMIIKQATSLKWIWEELTVIYQHQHKGKEFLTITDLDYNPAEQSPVSFYNSYRAKIMENLKPAGTTVKWKNNTTTKVAETISPTFEDHILLTTLLIIDKRLPSKIKEVYGPRIEKGIFLMDLKMDILSNVSKILEDMETDTSIDAVKVQDLEYKAAYMGQRGNRRSRGKGRFNSERQQRYQQSGENKFCRLCHLARQQRNVVLSHEIGDMNCPSMSARDKEGIKSKYSMNANVQVDEEEDIIEKMAQLHGYDQQVNNIDKVNLSTKALTDISCDHSHLTPDNNIHVIKPVPSQILTVFQQDIPIHLDLDSGCWISTVKYDYALKMKWNIHPNGQLARIADGKTVLKARGEIHETFNRNSWTVQFSAIVMDQLHTEAIAGNNFFKDNNIRQDITARTITINNKYVIPETNRNTELPVNPINTIVTLPKTIMLPKQTIRIDIPEAKDVKEVFIEPLMGKNMDIQSQICAVIDGAINIENHWSKPVKLNKAKLHVKEVEIRRIDKEAKAYKIMALATNKNAHDNLKNITIDRDKLNRDQSELLDSILAENTEVFDQNLRKGYNHNAGPHFCKLKFANDEKPSSRKVSCVQYNSQMNGLLQQVCDELTEANVLGIPQHENVEVQHVMPIFLRKKQKAKNMPNNELTTTDVRLVVNTCELSKYMKSLPAKISKPQDVYNALAKWKYIIKTDLHQGFFQNHLHKDAQKWCGILTPFGGLRFFKRGIQGLINQTEELDELLANCFNKMLTQGKLAKLADDLFTGGKTIEEALTNLGEMLKICKDNNLKLSPSKTVILPATVDVMSWIWSEGGTLAPSPHRKQALREVKLEDLKTVKDIRSWAGLYKTFLYHTPNLAKIMDPFDKITGDKESKDEVVWTAELQQAFQTAKDHIENIKDVYLPHPDDQLIILTDGARTPPGVGFVLQARDQKGTIRTVRHYSVKLKPHHIKWSPCEIESVAFGTAIQAFYDIIKESNKPVIICPDSKPVCDATKLLQKGKFSLSPRIQTFLNNMGKISCDVQHISGKSGQNHVADYQSRNTFPCNADICQLCDYVNQQADTIIDSKVASIQPEIPYANREAWKNVQRNDKAISIAKTAISTGQLISKKSGKINSDARKIVANAKIAPDGLLVVHRSIHYTTEKEERIIIPSDYLPTLVNQLHSQNNHPSKHQLKQLFDKYFFGTGVANIIEDKSNNCQTCCSLKKLPMNNHFTSSTNAKVPGTHFGGDVIKRAKQKILVVRDQFSSYTVADFISDETSETLEDNLIKLVTPIRHSGKIIVRTDQATGFTKALKSSKLAELDISIELGNSLNKNSNAVIDKGIQELEKEITIIVPGEKPIDQVVLSKALMNLNNRLRRSGAISARNILFSRDDKRMININLNDQAIAQDQLKSREYANQGKNKDKPLMNTNVTKGDQVMLNKNPSKHNARDTFEVIAEKGESDYKNEILIKKISNPSAFRNTKSKMYSIRKDQIFKVHKDDFQKKELHYKHKIKHKPFDPIRREDTSSSEDDYDEIDFNDTNDNDEDNDDTIIQESNEADENHFQLEILEDINRHDDDNDYTSAAESVEDQSDQNYQETQQVGEKSKSKGVKESWIVSKQANNYSKLENIKKKYAAIKIQKWYRKKSQKQKPRYPTRNRKTPETFRNQDCLEDSFVPSATEQEREFSEQESTETLEWDPEPECTEFYDELNEAFLAADLDLNFKRDSKDLMAVYDFKNVLPIESERNDHTKKSRKPFKYLKKLVRKGDTLTKRQ